MGMDQHDTGDDGLFHSSWIDGSWMQQIGAVGIFHCHQYQRWLDHVRLPYAINNYNAFHIRVTFA